MGLLDQWNKNKFSIYKSEEKTVLKLLDSVSKWIDVITKKVDEVDTLSNDNQKKKVSYEDLHTKYQLTTDGKSANFDGTWQGLKKPTLSEEGAFAQVEKNTESIVNINEQLEQIAYLTEAIDDTIITKQGITIMLKPNKVIKIPTLLIQNINNLTIDGNNSKIIITEKNKSLYFSNCQNLKIHRLKISQTEGDRVASSSGLYLSGINTFLIEDVEINRTNASGIIIYRSKNGTIRNNIIKNTLADGIHITDNSENINIYNNTLYNTGDDSIATVSYQKDSGQCKNIFINSNKIEKSNSRGIANIGSKNVMIVNNIIEETSSSGIIVANDSSYNTLSPLNTTIKNNQVYSSGKFGAPKGNLFGVEVNSTSNTLILDSNIIKDSVTRGFNIQGVNNIITNNIIFRSGTTCQIENQENVIVGNNTFEENAQQGLVCINCKNSNINFNTFKNNNTSNTLGVDNAFFNNCVDSNFIGNATIDTRETVLVERSIEFYSCNNIRIKNTIEKVPNKIIACTGTSSNIEMDIVINTVNPTATIYKEGQLYINKTTKEIFVLLSGVWYKTSLTSV